MALPPERPHVLLAGASSQDQLSPHLTFHKAGLLHATQNHGERQPGCPPEAVRARPPPGLAQKPLGKRLEEKQSMPSPGAKLGWDCVVLRAGGLGGCFGREWGLADLGHPVQRLLL